MRAATIKISYLRQGNCTTFVYASKYQQLTCNTNWNQVALVSQFHFGLWDDAKDYYWLCQMPIFLIKASSLIVRCDDRLNEWSMEKRHTKPIWQTIAKNGSSLKSNFNGLEWKPKNMQIDAIQYKSLIQKENIVGVQKVEARAFTWVGKTGSMFVTPIYHQNQGRQLFLCHSTVKNSKTYLERKM